MENRGRIRLVVVREIVVQELWSGGFGDGVEFERDRCEDLLLILPVAEVAWRLGRGSCLPRARAGRGAS
jgi:hypothetical protein